MLLSPLRGCSSVPDLALVAVRGDRERAGRGLRLVGERAPVEEDRTRIHDLTNEALHAYAASDARLARILTERRWATASRFVDRIDELVAARVPWPLPATAHPHAIPA